MFDVDRCGNRKIMTMAMVAEADYTDDSGCREDDDDVEVSDCGEDDNDVEVSDCGEDDDDV